MRSGLSPEPSKAENDERTNSQTRVRRISDSRIRREPNLVRRAIFAGDQMQHKPNPNFGVAVDMTKVPVITRELQGLEGDGYAAN